MWGRARYAAPNSRRFRTHLSALINFAKFREEKLEGYSRLTHQTDELLAKKQDLEESLATVCGRCRHRCHIELTLCCTGPPASGHVERASATAGAGHPQADDGGWVLATPLPTAADGLLPLARQTSAMEKEVMELNVKQATLKVLSIRLLSAARV